MADESVLAQLDPIIAADTPPAKLWDEDTLEFNPNYDLARKLLAVPVSQGSGEKQMSGRTAKALDAWIAQELRRAGFPPDSVWPRTKAPRVLPADVAPIEEAVAVALQRLDDFDDRLKRFADQSRNAGVPGPPPSAKALRSAIARLVRTGKNNPLPGRNDAHILGRFYTKQVDVVVSSWQRGPDVLVSSKTQLSSYAKNKNNRYEEAVGEIKNLRDRHPMAATGFAYLVRTNVYEEKHAFAYLRDLLIRLRRPDGDFDATMLLVADWDDATLTVTDVRSATDKLSAERFFKDLVQAVTSNTPVDQHSSVRDLLPEEPPPGGLPTEEEALVDDTADID